MISGHDSFVKACDSVIVRVRDVYANLMTDFQVACVCGLKLLVYEAVWGLKLLVYAVVWGLKLLVYEALSYCDRQSSRCLQQFDDRLPGC